MAARPAREGGARRRCGEPRALAHSAPAHPNPNPIQNQDRLGGRAAAPRASSHPVLAYVTPWNAAGTGAALRWRGRLTHASPVWYQLAEGSGGGAPMLQGGAGVDEAWLEAVRAPVLGSGDQESSGPPAQPLAVVPRVTLELGRAGLAALVLGPPEHSRAIAASLAAEAKRRRYDGWVLDGLAPLFGAATAPGGGGDAVVRGLARLVGDLATALGLNRQVIIAAPPPPLDGGDVGAYQRLLAALEPHVAFVSLMTYDHATTAPGPTGPLAWVQRCVRVAGEAVGPSKVLAGVPLYAVAFGPDGGRDAATCVAALPALAAAAASSPGGDAPLTWDFNSGEHSFVVPPTGPAAGFGAAGSTVYLPTPASVAARMHGAAAQGAGVALWEAGQALDFVFDVL